MKLITESKVFRQWTYFIGFIILLIVLIMNFGEIFNGLADLIRALNGR